MENLPRSLKHLVKGNYNRRPWREQVYMHRLRHGLFECIYIGMRKLRLRKSAKYLSLCDTPDQEVLNYFG